MSERVIAASSLPISDRISLAIFFLRAAEEFWGREKSHFRPSDFRPDLARDLLLAEEEEWGGGGVLGTWVKLCKNDVVRGSSTTAVTKNEMLKKKFTREMLKPGEPSARWT